MPAAIEQSWPYTSYPGQPASSISIVHQSKRLHVELPHQGQQPAASKQRARGGWRGGGVAVVARRGGDARPPSVRKNDKSDPRRSGTATGASDQTLLKKLFAKEVRVDRARLLQVFRFLAASDFLRAETRLDALWVFPWADDPERDPQREKQRLRKLALEAAEAQEEEEEEETKR